MKAGGMKAGGILIWAGLGVAIIWPLWAAASSPLLEWRDPIYIMAGFSGVVGLALLLVQPLLAARALPGIPAAGAHFWSGNALLGAVLLHVAGLWITSPPDVVDALLFRSPTPFSAWGVVAMWAVGAAALLAAFRHKLGLRIWRVGHSLLIVIVILGSIVHAWMIQGTMATTSKACLCLLVVCATGWTLWRRRVWRLLV